MLLNLPTRNKGFTLIEVMVVVAILGILAAIVVPKVLSRPEQARMVKVKQDILAIQSALDLYRLDKGSYPSTQQGLKVLLPNPNANSNAPSWQQEGYLAKIPVDPWGEPYQYQNSNNKIRIYSYGPAGKGGSSEIDNYSFD